MSLLSTYTPSAVIRAQIGAYSGVRIPKRSGYRGLAAVSTCPSYVPRGNRAICNICEPVQQGNVSATWEVRECIRELRIIAGASLVFDITLRPPLIINRRYTVVGSGHGSCGASGGTRPPFLQTFKLYHRRRIVYIRSYPRDSDRYILVTIWSLLSCCSAARSFSPVSRRFRRPHVERSFARSWKIFEGETSLWACRISRLLTIYTAKVL